jgi:hypothetical protein
MDQEMRASSMDAKLAHEVTDKRLLQVAHTLRRLIAEQPAQAGGGDQLGTALEHVCEARAIMKRRHGRQ